MNKKLFFILTIIHLNIFCISAQIYPVRPQLSDKHSFSMILLPDPQSYNKFDANQPLFELQTAWIANSIEPLNIKGVLCTGDLVEQNEIRIPDGINGNQTSEEQWQAGEFFSIFLKHRQARDKQPPHRHTYIHNSIHGQNGVCVQYPYGPQTTPRILRIYSCTLHRLQPLIYAGILLYPYLPRSKYDLQIVFLCPLP